MPTLADIRIRGEADVQKRLEQLDERHRAMVRAAIKQYGRVENIPESVWEEIERDTDRELAAAIILLMISADSWSMERLDGQGVRTPELDGAAESGYAALAARRAIAISNSTTTTLRNRLERKTSDSRLSGPGDVGDLTDAGIEEALDEVFSDTRRDGIATDATTRGVSDGQIGARDRAAGGDGASTVDGQPMTITLIWRTHPERSKTGTCPRCTPLNGQPESVWGQVFPEGPGDEAHPNCVCTLDLVAVPFIRDTDEAPA